MSTIPAPVLHALNVSDGQDNSNMTIHHHGYHFIRFPILFVTAGHPYRKHSRLYRFGIRYRAIGHLPCTCLFFCFRVVCFLIFLVFVFLLGNKGFRCRRVAIYEIKLESISGPPHKQGAKIFSLKREALFTFCHISRVSVCVCIARFCCCRTLTMNVFS